METEPLRHFVALVSTDRDGHDTVIYINFDQIRMVDDIRSGHCRIWMSETQKIDLNGTGAARFIARLTDRSVDMFGKGMHIPDQNVFSPESESQGTEPSPSQTQEP